jgi:hypothetical protein
LVNEVIDINETNTAIVFPRSFSTESDLQGGRLARLDFRIGTGTSIRGDRADHRLVQA